MTPSIRVARFRSARCGQSSASRKGSAAGDIARESCGYSSLALDVDALTIGWRLIGGLASEKAEGSHSERHKPAKHHPAPASSAGPTISAVLAILQGFALAAALAAPYGRCCRA